MSYLDALPNIIAAIIVVVLLAGSIYFWRRYRRDLRAARVLPQPESIRQAPPTLLEKGRGAIAGDIVTSWTELPAREKDLAYEALWAAMLLETTADGTIDDREMRFVADLFTRLSGTPMAPRPVVEAAEQIQQDKKSALADIAKASDLAAAMKQRILAGAFLVSVSDETLAESETSCLGDIADALAIGRRERTAIYKGITDRLGI